MACAGWSDGTCGGSDLLDPQVAWGCYGMLIFGADGLAIGDGEANTADIIADCAYAGIAARIAGDSSLGGQDDWFLPSRGELNALCKWAFNDNRNEVCNNNGDGGRVLTNGGFHPGAYQSSSEISMDSMWGQGFNNGNYIGDLKRLPGNLVRPVRAF